MRDFMARLGIWGELLQFLWKRKLYWLLPMIFVIAILAAFIVLSSNPVLAPFLYPLF
jgi:Family of unknown function (DUF5989)